MKTIRGRILLAFTGLVLLTGCATGLAAYWILRDELETRHAAETAANAARLLGSSRLPPSPRLARDLASILSCEIVLGDPAGKRVLAASLATTNDDPSQLLTGGGGLSRASHGDTVTLSGRVFRRASTLIPAEAGGAGPTELIVLLDRRQYAGLRHLLAWRIGGITAVVMAAGWLLAAWLAASIARPARRLADALSHLGDAPDAVGDLTALAAGGTGGTSSRIGRFDPAELRQLEQAFARMQERLAAAQERLARAIRVTASGRLASAVVHELRNTVSGIKMNARVLADESAARGPADPGLAVILREAERMDRYLTDLQWVAAGAGNEAWPLPAGAATSSPEVAIREAMAAVDGRCRHAGVACTLAEGFPAVRVAAPGEAVRQVLLNLLVNAIEVTPAGGGVSVTIEPAPGDRARVAVADGGPGVRLPAGEELFVPFSSTKPHGTGLGLFICRRVVERYGGSIGWENPPGGGARFWFELPIASARQEALGNGQ